MRLRRLAMLGYGEPPKRRGVLPRLTVAGVGLSIALLVGGAIGAQTTASASVSIVIGAPSSPEGALLEQLYGQALEARGFTVTYRQGIASAKAADRALRTGTIDMYPEYTGVVVRTLFGQRSAAPTYLLAKKLQAKRGVALLNPTPFVQTVAIAMLRSTAVSHRVHSLSDLKGVPKLAIGLGPDLKPLGRTVSRLGARVVPLKGGSPYAALAANTVVAAAVAASDPVLGRSSAYTLLRDSTSQLDLGGIAPVVTDSRLAALGARFTTILNAVSATLTRTALRTMNANVLVGKKPTADVAKAFLSTHRLISAANVFVAPNGSDSGTNCRRFSVAVSTPDAGGASVCKSLAKAYLLARPGETIEMQAGDYPPQTIPNKSRAAAPDIVIRPAAGATVTLEDLTTNGDYVTIEDVTVRTETNHNRGWRSTSSHITLDGVAVTGPFARVDIGGDAKDVTWENGSLGTPGNTTSRVCGLDGGPSSDPQPVQLSNVTDATFSNLDFYPFIAELNNPACGPDNVMHLETIRVNDGVENFRLERSRFHRGDGSGTARLFVTKLVGRNSDNLTVVNNWFGAADGKGGGSVSVLLGGNQACVNYVFAYNLFEQGFVPDCKPMTSLTLVGNTGVGPAYLCEGTTHIRNLWTWSSAGSCGSDRWVRDTNFSLAALRYAADGYHLLPKSPAIDAGDKTECAALTGGLDIDGQLRLGTCDAGPDEFKR